MALKSPIIINFCRLAVFVSDARTQWPILAMKVKTDSTFVSAFVVLANDFLFGALFPAAPSH